MSIVICIGRPSIDKVASGEPCDVGQGVTLLAADDLFHASPYAEIERLRDRTKAALEVVNAQAEDEALWCQPVYASEAYLLAALRRLHEAVEGKSSEQCARAVLD